MNHQLIYFARSIRGDRDNGVGKYYKVIADRIRSMDYIPAMEADALLLLRSGQSAEQFIYHRDINWIDNSIGMIADVTNPSLGVGYEIAYANHVAQLPILCVALAGEKKVSAMISGAFEIAYYHDDDELDTLVQDWLRDFKKIVEGR